MMVARRTSESQDLSLTLISFISSGFSVLVKSSLFLQLLAFLCYLKARFINNIITALLYLRHVFHLHAMQKILASVHVHCTCTSK